MVWQAFFLGKSILNTHDVQKERKFAAEAKLGLENPEHSTKQVQNFAAGDELELENPDHSKKQVQNFSGIRVWIITSTARNEGRIFRRRETVE